MWFVNSQWSQKGYGFFVIFFWGGGCWTTCNIQLEYNIIIYASWQISVHFHYMTNAYQYMYNMSVYDCIFFFTRNNEITKL